MGRRGRRGEDKREGGKEREKEGGEEGGKEKGTERRGGERRDREGREESTYHPLILSQGTLCPRGRKTFYMRSTLKGCGTSTGHPAGDPT